MKSVLSCFIFSLLLCLNAKAQETDSCVAVDEMQLRQAIAHRGDSLGFVKKGKEVQTLMSEQIADLTQLVELLDRKLIQSVQQQKSIEETQSAPRVIDLATEDSTIFNSREILDMQVPVALKKHHELLCTVIEIEGLLDDIDKRIEEVTEMSTQYNLDVNENVRKSITPIVNAVVAKFGQLKSSGLHSFSQEQKQYYENLRSRYNSLERYYKKTS